MKDYIHLRRWQSILAACAAILGIPSLIIATWDATPKLIDRISDLWFDSAAYSGTWGDEGAVDAPVPNNPLQMTLVAKNGELAGSIGSMRMDEGWTYPTMLVEGTAGWFGGSFQVFDYVAGQKSVYAFGTLSPVGSGDEAGLRVTITNQMANGFLPERADLFRSAATQ